MNDATRKGASANAGGAELENGNEGVDNDTENQEDRNLPSEHPVQKREDIYARFSRERDDLEEGEPYREVEDSDEDDGEEGNDEESDDQDQDDSDSSDEDGLDKYITEKDGAAYFKAVVDGESKLIPLDRAQAQLQKHEAADVRLQQASELRRSLDARAEQLQLAERDSQQRSPSQQQDVNAEDDESLLTEAQGLISSLMEEDEAEAAKKLAAALKKARSTGEPIDREALVTEVAEATAQRLQGNETQEALADGYNAYMREYGDTKIETDSALRAWHGAKVDELAAANPDWSPKQCMLKAGEMACEFAGIKVPSASETITTEDEGGDPPENSDEPNPRQERKRNLQPLPDSRSAVSDPKGGEEKSQTARDVLNEMRASRGQPVNAG